MTDTCLRECHLLVNKTKICSHKCYIVMKVTEKKNRKYRKIKKSKMDCDGAGKICYFGYSQR